jgi:hypothetical protein
VIADSVAFVGIVGLLGRPARFRWFSAAMLTFGLVHGLGLATRFQALLIPPGGTLSRLLAFNLGIEHPAASPVGAPILACPLTTAFHISGHGTDPVRWSYVWFRIVPNRATNSF